MGSSARNSMIWVYRFFGLGVRGTFWGCHYCDWWKFVQLCVFVMTTQYEHRIFISFHKTFGIRGPQSPPGRSFHQCSQFIFYFFEMRAHGDIKYLVRCENLEKTFSLLRGSKGSQRVHSFDSFVHCNHQYVFFELRTRFGHQILIINILFRISLLLNYLQNNFPSSQFTLYIYIYSIYISGAARISVRGGGAF